MNLLLLGLIGGVALTSCFIPTDATAQAPQPPADSADQKAIVQSNNSFAVDLYGQLRARDGNLFFSPDSISTALAMAYAGARGDTALEMAKTLHFTLPPARLHPAMGAQLANLNAAHAGYQLHVADALWAEKDFNFLDSYIKLMNSDYGAGFNRVDFKDAPERARTTINEWIAQKTENKITDLLPQGSVSPATRLVLTNAIYFKGNWQTQFEKSQTQDDDFRLTAATTTKAPLMHRSGAFRYFSGGSFQMLEIPYKSNELSMIVLLPNDAAGLPALEQGLTADNVESWLEQLKIEPKVILTLPKFKLTEEFELADTLGAMGMPNAFARTRADFSGMTGKRDLWISAVIHKAFVDVNEEGTEAAAATGITMRSAMVHMPDRIPPIIFRADHPFVFLIRDTVSGSILFMGRVTDPTK
jgi:serpin B